MCSKVVIMKKHNRFLIKMKLESGGNRVNISKSNVTITENSDIQFLNILPI